MKKLFNLVETENQSIFMDKKFFTCDIHVVIIFLQTRHRLNDIFLKVRCHRMGKDMINLVDLRKWNLAGQIFPHIVVKITDRSFGSIF